MVATEICHKMWLDALFHFFLTDSESIPLEPFLKRNLKLWTRENLSFCVYCQIIIFSTFHHDKCALTIMLTGCGVGGIPFCVCCVAIIV